MGSVSRRALMKTSSYLVLGLFFTLYSSATSQAAAQFGRQNDRQNDRVCVYQDIQYQGWEQCYSAGDEVADLRGRKNSISSIRLYGRARVTIYEQEAFQGNSAEFTSDVPDLGLRSLSGSRSWNDRVDSLRVSADSGRRVFGNDPQDFRDGICVYERAGYQGRSECWRAGDEVSDLGRVGHWSDTISSIRLFGSTRVVLYRDVHFQGESLFVDRDIPDLGRVGGRGFPNWNDQVSSIDIVNGRGRGRNSRWGDRGR
jgi:hypothetical protein